MTPAPFSKTPRSWALLSSWRHDGQDCRDKQTTKFTPPHPPPPDWVPTNGFVTFLQVRWPLHALTRNLRWNVCNEIQAADIQSTWRLAEAEFIIINRNNIKLFHFTISGDRNIIFFKLIFHVFVWIPLQFRQMNAFTRQHFQDSTLPSRW